MPTMLLLGPIETNSPNLHILLKSKEDGSICNSTEIVDFIIMTKREDTQKERKKGRERERDGQKERT